MKEWTDVHRREALRRTYEIAAEHAEYDSCARPLADDPWVNDEQMWRQDLASILDAVRIDREVRRVRALSEGRLVRETVYQSRRRYSDGSLGALALAEDSTRAGLAAHASAMHHNRDEFGIVRVTRIRRAVKT